MLAEHDEKEWSQAIRKTLHRIREGDTNAVRSFLQLYGGMGSFSDLVISPRSSCSVPDARTIAVNDELGGLRSRAHSLAVDVLHQAAVK